MRTEMMSFIRRCLRVDMWRFAIILALVAIPFPSRGAGQDLSSAASGSIQYHPLPVRLEPPTELAPPEPSPDDALELVRFDRIDLSHEGAACPACDVAESGSDWRSGLAQGPVRTLHGLLEFKTRAARSLEETWEGTWIESVCERHQARNRRASVPFQYHSVNWRPRSISLQGSLPCGYTLLHYVENVPVCECHAEPLHANGPIEPGGTFEEATMIDGVGARDIRSVSLDIAPPAGNLPEDRARAQFAPLVPRTHLPGTHRSWNGMTYSWNASLLNHQPLYFEDVNLERHGFSYGAWQPLVSGTKFFSTLPALPYLMVARPPAELEFTLGETRAGRHSCYVHDFPPASSKAGLVEAGVVTGLFFLIP